MEDVKKLERKKKRFAARLKSSKGIIFTDVPGIVSTVKNLLLFYSRIRANQRCSKCIKLQKNLYCKMQKEVLYICLHIQNIKES